jgi:hypothetical protein
MGDLPIDKRAYGLLFREWEREGWAEPSAELRRYVDSLPYTPEEIDDGLDLIVDSAGRTLGQSMKIEDLHLEQLDALLIAGIIEICESGWQLTDRGRRFSDVLDHYAQATFRKIR